MSCMRTYFSQLATAVKSTLDSYLLFNCLPEVPEYFRLYVVFENH